MVTSSDITAGESLLDELECLLQKQIEFAQQDNIGRIEQLAEQAGTLIEKIQCTGIAELPRFEQRFRRLKDLYERLSLALAASRTQITNDLKQLNKGKKTLKTYRANIKL